MKINIKKSNIYVAIYFFITFLLLLSTFQKQKTKE